MHTAPLPLGRDPRTGSQSELLSPDGTPYRSIAAILEDVEPIRSSSLHALVKKGPLHESASSSTVRELLDELTSYPNAKETVSRCEILRLIAHKAITLQHLESEERASLYEALGYLPEQEVVVTLQRLLEPCGRGDRDRVRKRLSTLGAYPISCKKLVERHGKLSPTGACASCSHLKPGRTAYPTPLLHAMAVDKVFRHGRTKSGKRPSRARKKPHKSPPKPLEPKASMAPSPPLAPAPPSSEHPAEQIVAASSPPKVTLRELVEDHASARARADALLAELAAHERRLDIYCDVHGDRVFLEGVGWLVRRTDRTPRFIIEL